MADNNQASASPPDGGNDMPSGNTTDEQQQQQQQQQPRTDEDEVDAPSQTNDNVAKKQTKNTSTALDAFEQRLMEKALSKKNVITNNNEEESSTTLLQQENNNMSTTDESFPSNIHGLEVVPDDKDLPRPSSDFDDSIEKKKKKTINNNNIGELDINNNDEDEEEGPPLPPRITFDDSLEEKRRKVGIIQEEYDATMNNNNSQACAASSTTDDEWMSDMSEKIQRNVQARNTVHENSRRDTEQHDDDDDVGTLSVEETQRRRGDNNNNNGFHDVEVGRGQDENIIASTTRRRRRSIILASLFPQMYGSDVLVEATLVESNASFVVGEVVEAERVGYCARRWKSIGICLVSLLVLFAVLLSVTLALGVFTTADDGLISDVPSMQPSSSPTWDTRPTFDIVRERGYVLCGISNVAISLSEGSIVDLCRAVAAVVLGDPTKFEIVEATYFTRFDILNDREVDLLMAGVAHTVEREVRERTTESGYAFSSAYDYDGLTYMGNETYVRCAEQQKRYDECLPLVICVLQGTTSDDFIRSTFPSDFFLGVPSYDEMTQMLLDGRCNAAGDVRSGLLYVLSRDEMRDTNYTIGDKMMASRELFCRSFLCSYCTQTYTQIASTQTEDPHTIVTRPHDHEFSDIINWVVQALFYGEEQGIETDQSLCQDYLTSSKQLDARDLSYMNAVYCVGNYEEIKNNEMGINMINNGTGMITAIPFGELGVSGISSSINNETCLCDMRLDGVLKCGVIVPNGFIGNVTDSRDLVGMNVDYCYTLAAALFNGKWEAAQLFVFSEEEDSYAALANGTIDVIAGVRAHKKYDFASESLPGFHFSIPYFYGNETASESLSMFSLATPEDRRKFSSFVNAIVVATIDAQKKGITKERSNDMPLMYIFGSLFNWSLRDAISYSGNYDELFAKNFDIPVEDRGRNAVNKGGPQLHSIPGLP